VAVKTDRIPPFLRAFALLERLAAAEAPLSLHDATAGAGLPKPTVYRMLAMLEQAGLVSREPGARRVSAGPRLARFALDVLRNGAASGARRAILQQLAASIGETCNLTLLDGFEVVYLDRVESAWPLRVALQPGSRVPLHCTASGKLLLALLPAARRRRLVAALALTRYTDNTIVDARRLEAELARVRRERLAVDNEEYLAGLVCVAVPVTGAHGRVAACVAVQAPAARMPLAVALDHVPALRHAAAALAATFAPDVREAAVRGKAVRRAGRPGRRTGSRAPRPPAGT
jgi:IclR family acetate operon transcriptional repressor